MKFRTFITQVMIVIRKKCMSTNDRSEAKPLNVKVRITCAVYEGMWVDQNVAQIRFLKS